MNKNKYFKYPILLFLCIITLGCASVNKEISLEKSKASLLVATTLMSEKSCDMWGNNWNIVFDEVDNPSMINAYILFLEPKKNDGLPGINGRLVVYETNAEEYEITALQSSTEKRLISSGYRFKTREGKATYIGRIIVNIHGECESYSMEIEDYSESDTKLLLKRYPNLKNDDVVIDIAK